MNGKIKYLYSWLDWGLYDIRTVEVVQEDYPNPRFPNEEFSLVRSDRVGGGREPAPAPKEFLFDTYEEADAYGREHTPAGAW